MPEGRATRVERRRTASVKDVATRAGVSLGTVSNVLNRPDRVSTSTRARVEQAMADLGFVRNESARSLRAGQSHTLAYVMLDASNPFFTDVAQGIEQAADETEMSLFLCNSDNHAEREAKHLAHLQERRVQGILITPVDPDSSLLDEIVGHGTPLVIVDRTRKADNFCTVAVDDHLGGRLAAEHLIDQGHKRIAFVGGPLTLGQVSDRYEGARQAWADAGLPASDLVLISCESLTVAEGRAAGEQLAGIPRKRRPTAAMCANDLIALGLLQQAIARGWSVPGDLALVGYDDIEFAAAAAVPLTSVRQPRQELGRTAAELVVDESTNPRHAHQQVTFTPTLVARASTLG
jgi:LacI family transcriptional regulator